MLTEQDYKEILQRANAAYQMHCKNRLFQSYTDRDFENYWIMKEAALYVEKYEASIYLDTDLNEDAFEYILACAQSSLESWKELNEPEPKYKSDLRWWIMYETFEYVHETQYTIDFIYGFIPETEK